MDRVDLEIEPVSPYDPRAVFGFLSRCRGEAVDLVDGTELRRGLEIAGLPVAVTVKAVGDVEQPRLLVRLEADHLNDEVVSAASLQLRRLLNTDVDPAPFLEIAAKDPRLAPISLGRRGLRPTGTPTVFEAVIWAITGQHISLAIACMLKRTLVDGYGDRFAGLTLFPTTRALATANPDDLGRRGFTRAKSRAIVNFAGAVASGTFDPEALRGKGQGEAIAALTAFPGIGRWTAEYVLARGLGDPDAFPAGDAGLRHAVSLITGDQAPSEQRIREFAEPYAGWRAHLAFLLWSTL